MSSFRIPLDALEVILSVALGWAAVEVVRGLASILSWLWKAKP